MPTVSSLLRSAQSAQKKVRQQKDAIAAFEWENSAQTYEDFVQYSKKLEDSGKQATDVSEALTYQNKLRSARRSYTTNEIQRSAISILEGRGTLQDKQNTIYNLAQQAADNGDMNLVQNLVQQYDSLSVQIQNESERQAKAAIAAAGSAKKAADDYEKRVKQDLKAVGQLLQSKGPDAINAAFNEPGTREAILKENPQLKALYDQNGQIGFWDVIYGAVEGVKQTYRDAIAQSDGENALDLQAKLDDIEQGFTGYNIPGIGKVTANDIQDQMDAARYGGTAYYAGVDGLEKGDKTNFGWKKGADGKWGIATQFSQKGTQTAFGARYTQDQRTGDDLSASLVFKRDNKGNFLNEKGEIVGRMGRDGQLLDAKGKEITDEAQRNQILKQSTTEYKTLLENNGFKVSSTSNGTLKLIPTDKVAERFKELDINSGTPVEAVVDPQGNVRFVKPNAQTGEKELFQIGFDDKGAAYTQKLLEGGEGAVGADTYYNMRQGFQKYAPNTPFGGVNAGRQSLMNSSELIARGENFRYGKLAYDMETRRKFLEQQAADGIKLNTREQIVVKAVQPVASAIGRAVKRAANNIGSTPGMNAALSSQRAAVEALKVPAKKGVLQDPIRARAAQKDVGSASNPGNRNFAQKLAGFIGF